MTIDRAQLSLLQRLARCKNSRSRKALLEQGGTRLQEAVREVCHNLLEGNIPLTDKSLTRLRRHRHVLRALARKKTSLKQRVALNQRGGFLAALLPVALSTLVSLVTGLVRR